MPRVYHILQIKKGDFLIFLIFFRNGGIFDFVKFASFNFSLSFFSFLVGGGVTRGFDA